MACALAVPLSLVDSRQPTLRRCPAALPEFVTPITVGYRQGNTDSLTWRAVPLPDEFGGLRGCLAPVQQLSVPRLALVLLPFAALSVATILRII